jgi:hypothetical protein
MRYFARSRISRHVYGWHETWQEPPIYRVRRRAAIRWRFSPGW